jgi:hypothetical protein
MAVGEETIFGAIDAASPKPPYASKVPSGFQDTVLGSASVLKVAIS